MVSRRSFLRMSLMAGAAASFPIPSFAAAGGPVRRYNLCLDPRLILKEPDRLNLLAEAGVSTIWMAGFFYGHWGASIDQLRAAGKLVEAAGMGWQLITVPLGHPGDALGDSSGETPTSPPDRWAYAERPDGSRYSGTSLHPPATDENVKALKEMRALQPGLLFLDDDFRLATGPGVIGGCFCAKHREAFLQQGGYPAERWPELLDAVAQRRLSPLLRSWVDFTCAQLTACFRAQEAANPDCALGNMVMYLGAEKAGIRLTEYADNPFRVGEMMFNDHSFGSLKAKCDELFSALFHRRFARPELAYSETTAYPADQLSAKNMAAKLAVSTLTDVRNTMFMSGLTPFPDTHWAVLAPAMKKQAQQHERLAGAAPRGPFKHYWGEAMRYVGDDRPFSLFLASGVPFEVVEELPAKGHVFLADQDARHLPGAAAEATGATIYHRETVKDGPAGGQPLEESLEALWRLKADLLKAPVDFPYVVEDVPVVCAWYPDRNAVLLWNLSETEEKMHLHYQEKALPVSIPGLDTALLAL